MQKTYSQSKQAVVREWHLVDAKNQVLGRMATGIATKLIGKDKPTYTSHIDGGDAVVVINASQVVLTRTKAVTKEYFHHSLMPGGMKKTTFAKLKEEDPIRIIREAVYSMLPKNKLRTGRMNRLKIFADESHPHGTHFTK